MLTGNQLRAARALIGLDQSGLAEKAGVNINTISTMEKRGAAVLTSALDTVKAVMSALESEGVEFLNHGQPGVRLRKHQMAQFDRSEPAVITLISKPTLVGNSIQYTESRLPFLTFEEAVRHFMTALSSEDRAGARIDTRSNGRWFLSDILEITDPQRLIEDKPPFKVQKPKPDLLFAAATGEDGEPILKSREDDVAVVAAIGRDVFPTYPVKADRVMWAARSHAALSEIANRKYRAGRFEILASGGSPVKWIEISGADVVVRP